MKPVQVGVFLTVRGFQERGRRRSSEMSCAIRESYALAKSEEVESGASDCVEDRHRGRLRKMLKRLQNAPPLPLTVPLAIHYSLVTLALIATGKNPWMPSYFFSHIVVILAGVWAARDLQKVQPLLLYIYILLMSCVVDSIQLGSYLLSYDDITKEQHSIHRGLWIMSVTIIFIHLALKPLIALYSFVIVLQRCPSSLSCSSCCGRKRHDTSCAYGAIENGCTN